MHKGNVGFRQFFRPVQPSAAGLNEISYKEILPENRLAEYIYCYWELKSKYKLLTPFMYRVIPDGCIDIFFDLNDVSTSQIMGFSDTHTAFALGRCFHYIGIRFLPGLFSAVFNVDAASLTNREERLDDVLPKVASQLKNIIEGQTHLEKIKFSLDQFFLKKVASIHNGVDGRLSNAIMIILKTQGTLNLESEIDTGISSRQLRRMFGFYVGTSPKMFSKVVRFQYFFQLLSASKGNSGNKLFLDAGYYDQPHFNRDFKAFFGLTPSEALPG
jgi:hypothetical protein